MKSLTDFGTEGAEYHSAGGISSTQIKDWDKMSPASWYAKHVAQVIPKESKAAWDFGNAVHSLLLEPFDFDDRFAILSPDFNGRTKDGKALMASIKSKGAKVLKYEEYQLAKAMVKAVQENELCNTYKLFKAGECEAEFTCKHHTGLLLKAKPDWMRGTLIADLKTCLDANPAKFGRDCVNFGYQRSEAFYRHVLAMNEIDIESFLFVAVDKTAPIQVSVSQFDPEYIEHAEAQNEQALIEIAECLETGKWQGYNEINTIYKPKWA